MKNIDSQINQKWKCVVFIKPIRYLSICSHIFTAPAAKFCDFDKKTDQLINHI